MFGSMETTHFSSTSLAARNADSSPASILSLHTINKRSVLVGKDLMCSVNGNHQN